MRQDDGAEFISASLTPQVYCNDFIPPIGYNTSCQQEKLGIKEEKSMSIFSAIMGMFRSSEAEAQQAWMEDEQQRQMFEMMRQSDEVGQWTTEEAQRVTDEAMWESEESMRMMTDDLNSAMDDAHWEADDMMSSWDDSDWSSDSSWDSSDSWGSDDSWSSSDDSSWGGGSDFF